MKKTKRQTTSPTQTLLLGRERQFPSSLKISKTKDDFHKLDGTEVYQVCDIEISASKKKELKEPNYEIISQPRAVRAISLGLGIEKPGYNIYVAGIQGTGKNSVIRSFLKKTAESHPTPGDWIYVYNFKNTESPVAMELKTGMAKKFKKQMDELIEQLNDELVEAFQSEDYETNVNNTVNSSNERKAKLFNELEKTAKSKNFGVKSTRMGIVTVPIIEGKPLSEKDYSDLNDEQKEKIEAERNLLEPEVLDFARKVRNIEYDTKNKLDELQSELGNFVLNQAFLGLLKEYAKEKNILNYLDEVKNHILENLNEFLPAEEESEGEAEDSVSASSYMSKKGDPYLPYRVNVFVDNTDIKGAPIIIENNPTFYNLFGKIEKNIEYGVYTTDFKMIKAGSLARANGGYLVLNAIDILKTPHVWDTLKRVIKNQKLFIEDLGEQYSILATSGLRPEPISLNVKIILIGSDWIYRMLYQFDEDFNKIFKIKADFDAEMNRNQSTVEDYVSFISTRTKVENLLPFDSSAVAAIVEFGSRVVEDKQKLTTRFSLIKDITIEADFMCRERRGKKITREDVEKAVDEKYLRSSAIEDRIVEMIERKDIIISTVSRRIGEINGLAVYSLGDVSFGVPTRITCRTYEGKPGILNIEREASLSGKLHNKGISILTSWINGTFGTKKPVNMSVSLCFEQNYNGVDGDSATLAELCLILATIAHIPIDQGIAVTGSVNQFGDVQPIGGVNEKVEGFFKVCSLTGLTGRQGCIVPKQNVKNLMLHKDVQAAINNGKFHIWSVGSVGEAFALLTGFEAGVWDEKKGQFNKGSAFFEIDKHLHKKDEKKAQIEKEKSSSKRKVKTTAARKPATKKPGSKKPSAKKPSSKKPAPKKSSRKK